MTKYQALEVHLRESGQDSVPMTFADIEQVIGAALPASAFKHRPWWSNNPSNSSITHSWLKAGYKTENVDMAGQKLVFVKAAQYPPVPEASGHALRKQTNVFADAPAGVEAATDGFLSQVFGALKGTVTVAPGTDLTAPVKAEWDAAR